MSDPVLPSLFLENVEVTVNIPCSAVGIVAGYADADLRNIGVKNAIISFGDNNKAVESKYTLIGKTANENNWYDIPETGPAGGGDLIIVPNGYTKNSVVYAPFVSQAAGTTPVSQSVRNCQLYGSITKVEPSEPDPENGTFINIQTRSILTDKLIPMAKLWLPSVATLRWWTFGLIRPKTKQALIRHI